jgi:hypothetical protein
MTLRMLRFALALAIAVGCSAGTYTYLEARLAITPHAPSS